MIPKEEIKNTTIYNTTKSKETEDVNPNVAIVFSLTIALIIIVGMLVLFDYLK